MASLKQKSTAAKSSKKEAAQELKGPTVHVGQILRQGREERGVSLDNVADELMIRRFYLEALENGSFKDLPERVYALGFVRNYATYLGLQATSMVEQFKREAYGARSANNYQVELSMPQPVVQSVVPNRSAIISAVVVLVVLVIGIIFLAQDKKPAVNAIPEPVPTQESTPVVEAPTPSVAEGDAANKQTAELPAMEFTAPGPAATPTVTTTTETVAPVAEAPQAAAPSDVPPAALRVKNHRVLEALQSAWVEVRNDKGAILFTSILKAGQILPLPDDTRIMVTTGNAGGLRMIVDGKPQQPFGQQNEVKRNIVLDR